VNLPGLDVNEGSQGLAGWEVVAATKVVDVLGGFPGEQGVGGQEHGGHQDHQRPHRNARLGRHCLFVC